MSHRHVAILFGEVVLAAAVVASAGVRVGVVAAEPNEPIAGQPPSFESDVQPLLQAKCWRCHGEKVHKADLDLRSPAGILTGGESGPAVVAGKPEESLLYEKLHEGSMPPTKRGHLTDAQVEIVRRWIEHGAKASAENPGGDEVAAAANQHDIIPIVLRHCAACHGARRQEAGLDLRTRSTMLSGGKSGPAMVPGHPDQSLMLAKIDAGEMPPRDRLVEASVKPIEAAERELVARWIEREAPEVAVEPDVATTTPDPLVTDPERDFWAFKSPKSVSVPIVTGGVRVRNPIDAFVLQKLEEHELSLAPEAERLTLLRRATFDLTGLPPEPAQVEALLADTAPGAYERLIERLLASPHYGERWGRFWMDLAGYADSEGKREQDLPRPHAWRYRDYVIRAFNTDKPYDRFLLEQLAGDELADYENAPQITPELYDNLVATGFLRMAPDGTWANITGYAPDRLEVIADEVDVLGSAVMGLTMKCARCHSHKFDPIPQRDYYRLVDIFKGAFDEYDWLKPDVHPGIGPVSQDVLPGRHLPFVTTAERQTWEEHNAQITRDVEALKAAREKLPPDAASKPKSEEIDRQIAALESRRLPEPRIQAVWDRGEPSPTYVYRRGDYLRPSRLVGPGVPSVLTDGQTPFDVQPPWPGAKKTGRRLAFAKWLVRPDHPLTARVMVNRLWKHHFGTGLVTTPGNFGKAGALPTHPELLDWLATEFTRHGWSVKAMHRLMMTSATYRQSSAVTAEHEKLDPDGVLYSRMPLGRLDAEALYDTLLSVAGRLDETPFGPADTVQLRPDGLATPTGTDRGWRRLVYAQQMRKQIATHAENFDYPQMNPNCVERRDSTVALQALHLMNNGMVQQLSECFAERIGREAGTDRAHQIERIYLVALSRPPSDEERQLGLDALSRLTDHWFNHPATGSPDRDAAGKQALVTFCHAMMNSAGFLYVD